MTAPLTVAATASGWLSPLVCICTSRAASLYTSHNFWCAAAVSAGVYIGDAVVAGAAAGLLDGGRVKATIKAAALSTMATMPMPATATNGQVRERGAS
ncbi:hypothetical protein LAUMK35_03320 [Mycobacterium pseudokansasii]|nr:hypothetical protein LAUMK35_03320 [Mycobacterium pseudokansasii]VAZ97764.1 hypothetical protein LAUMK21_03310 [Mycobacterium pseudokansasii]